jgi:hypothetical protein
MEAFYRRPARKTEGGPLRPQGNVELGTGGIERPLHLEARRLQGGCDPLQIVLRAGQRMHPVARRILGKDQDERDPPLSRGLRQELPVRERRRRLYLRLLKALALALCQRDDLGAERREGKALPAQQLDQRSSERIASALPLIERGSTGLRSVEIDRSGRRSAARSLALNERNDEQGGHDSVPRTAHCGSPAAVRTAAPTPLLSKHPCIVIQQDRPVNRPTVPRTRSAR